MTQWAMRDLSYEVYGKYQFCTMAEDGMWYADVDFEHPGGFGKPKKGALPSPRQDTPELTARAKALHEASARSAVNNVLNVTKYPTESSLKAPTTIPAEAIPAHVIWMALAMAALYVCAIIAIWLS